MPWRDQVALLWKVARWVIWPPGVPLWGQLVYKIDQAVSLAGALLGAWWIFTAGCAVTLAMAWVTRPG